MIDTGCLRQRGESSSYLGLTDNLASFGLVKLYVLCKSDRYPSFPLDLVQLAETGTSLVIGASPPKASSWA